MSKLIYRYSNQYFSLSIKESESNKFQVIELNKITMELDDTEIHEFETSGEAYWHTLKIMTDWMKTMTEVSGHNNKR